MFLDEAVIHVRSGKGGHGCVSFRRETYIPRGGPNGGDGGDGGSVYLRASTQASTLVDLGYKRSFAAQNGLPGEGSDRHGKRGKDCIIDVPVGTVVREVSAGVPPAEGEIIGDLVDPSKRLRVARGGKGGKGNKAFATSTNQVPRYAEEGGACEERKLYLELKLLADVGLVGLPNAGKSTLLSRVSAATPKIADYPFTTLRPKLGIAELGDWSRLVVADIPGLIEGAHLGQGLGIDFLRHIERTRVLVQLVSCESLDPDAWEAEYRTIAGELASYSAALAAKPRLVVLSKLDLLPADEAGAAVRALGERLGVEVLPLSAATNVGVRELLARCQDLVRREDSRDAASTPSDGQTAGTAGSGLPDGAIAKPPHPEADPER